MNTKRLTKKYDNGFVTLDAAQFAPIAQETIDRNICAFEPFEAAVRRLAEYEDADRQGWLMWLPCNVGDTVYYLRNVYKGKKHIDTIIEPLVVDSFVIGDNNALQANTCNKERNEWTYYEIVDFGRYVFLTRESAEQALKEERT